MTEQNGTAAAAITMEANIPEVAPDLNRLPVTVVVPVKNESANLARCLAELRDFAQVLVVDSGSIDETPAIAHAFGATFLEFKWDGKYPKKRNWVLMNHRFTTPWVLFLDADEIITAAFRDELRKTLPHADVSAFWLNYTNYFIDRPLRYGLEQRKLALLKVGSGLYEKIEENSWSHLDMEVHEHPIVQGAIGAIQAKIDHNDFRGLASFIDRHRAYALWEAERYLALRSGGGRALAGLTPRQRFKYSNLETWWYPWFYFLFAYVGKLGFLDGAAGFHYAFQKVWYFTTIRLLIGESRRKLER